MFKAQKGSKDIVKIVQVTFIKVQEYFLCAEKMKITTSFNNFFSNEEILRVRKH